MIVVLPEPVAPTIGHPLAGRDAERDVAQHPLLAPVGEPDVLEHDLAARRRRRDRRGGRPLRLDVEEREDPLRRRHRRLHHRVLRAEVPDRHEELVDVLDERPDRPDLEGVAPQPGGAPQHHRDRHRADGLDQREQRRLEAVRELVGVAMVGVECRELREAALLARRQRDHRHARDGLLQVAVDARDALADLAVRAPRHAAEEVDGERPSAAAAPGWRAASRQSIHSMKATMPTSLSASSTIGHGAGGEHLAQDVDVGRDAGHDLADRIVIEAAPSGRRCRCANTAPAQLRQAALGDHHREVLLAVERHELADDQAHEEPRQAVQPVQVASA